MICTGGHLLRQLCPYPQSLHPVTVDRTVLFEDLSLYIRPFGIEASERRHRNLFTGPAVYQGRETDMQPVDILPGSPYSDLEDIVFALVRLSVEGVVAVVLDPFIRYVSRHTDGESPVLRKNDITLSGMS